MITLYKKEIKNKKNVFFQKLKFLKIGQIIKITMAIVQDKKIKKYTFIGRCIAYKKAGLNSFITLRNTFNKVGVEHSFLVYSSSLIYLDIIKTPNKAVKKSKLYYLKSKTNKFNII
jgi:ribosomal protein L19